jgi:hypothetical protein
VLNRIRHHHRQVAAPLLAIFALVWTIAVVAPCMAAMPCHASDQSEPLSISCPDCPTVATPDCQLGNQQVVRDSSRPPELALLASATTLYLLPRLEPAEAARPWPPRLAAAAVVPPQPASPHFVLRL